eukprot:CAMPEP_0172172044 /NCGR_PEP_ID=MMETSP1050-20130122/12227_1 /TAXON_ID=233186 /ORGANISM="Cryptomonas curvata, Strain CCAP979/52" /LENGTH=204 /DNA_ID=CAMNT_0012843539 /DNA_START=30 /DNA_END=644 /DNA_ORIENTATION=+
MPRPPSSRARRLLVKFRASRAVSGRGVRARQGRATGGPVGAKVRSNLRAKLEGSLQPSCQGWSELRSDRPAGGLALSFAPSVGANLRAWHEGWRPTTRAGRPPRIQPAAHARNRARGPRSKSSPRPTLEIEPAAHARIEFAFVPSCQAFVPPLRGPTAGGLGSSPQTAAGPCCESNAASQGGCRGRAAGRLQAQQSHGEFNDYL